jgi:hypothetical protein
MLLAWHIQHAQGRQCVEAFTPKSRGSGDCCRRPDHSRMILRAFAFMRWACALRSDRCVAIYPSLKKPFDKCQATPYGQV